VEEISTTKKFRNMYRNKAMITSHLAKAEAISASGTEEDKAQMTT
jgi:hypothetical protein